MCRLFRSFPALALLVTITAAARAEEADLFQTTQAGPGVVSQLITAQRGYEMALKSGDPVLLLAAVRLARGVVLRPPTSWERLTEGTAPADKPKGREAAPDPAPDPANPAAIAIVQNFAGDDPDLQDLVYDLDAQLPQGRKPVAVATEATLGVGQQDRWRLPLSGKVPAEIGLIGDGDGPLGLSVADGGGALVCALPASPEPGACRFTPAENGFFTVTIRNLGATENSYRLLGN